MKIFALDSDLGLRLRPSSSGKARDTEAYPIRGRTGLTLSRLDYRLRPMETEAILVYELVNPSLREVFVGVTARTPADIAARIRSHPPASIARWSWEALAPLREVDTFSSRVDAETFLTSYVTSLHRASPQWSVFCEDAG